MRVQGLGFGIEGSGFGILGFRVWDFGVQGLGFRVQGFGFRVGLAIEVQFKVYRVWGSGLKIPEEPFFPRSSSPDPARDSNINSVDQIRDPTMF